MFDFNNPVVRLVGSVVGVGVAILLVTIIPYGVVVFAVLIGIVYYFIRRTPKR